jgi:hypothetical protein
MKGNLTPKDPQKDNHKCGSGFKPSESALASGYTSKSSAKGSFGAGNLSNKGKK